MFTCPVCLYPYLSRPPIDEYICPSCGTEFGYDDFAVSHDELRRRWIDRGAPWFSQHNGPRADWLRLSTRFIQDFHGGNIDANVPPAASGTTGTLGKAAPDSYTYLLVGS